MLLNLGFHGVALRKQQRNRKSRKGLSRRLGPLEMLEGRVLLSAAPAAADLGFLVTADMPITVDPPRQAIQENLGRPRGVPEHAKWFEGVGWQLSDDLYVAPVDLASNLEVAATGGDWTEVAFAGSPAGKAPYGADYHDPSEFMLGKVWLTVVLLESDGSIDANIEDWTGSQITSVKNEIEEGATWWEDTLRASHPATPHNLEFLVDFTYADNPVATGYEPITRSYSNQTYWIDSFLNQVGYNTASSIWEDLDRWNHDQRLAHHTDWAYTCFVVNSAVDSDGMFSDGYFAYAYLGGPFTVMTYDNDGWGIGRMGQVLAHETGHIFYALDEYPGAGDYTDHSGYYNTQNLNAYDGHPNPSSRVASIMAEASLQNTAYANHTSSPTSLQMLGWLDSDGDGVFDLLDVPLSLTGSGSYNDAAGLYSFSGSSSVNTLDNLNPYSYRHDITINTVDTLQYRLDGGAWVSGSTYGDYSVSVAQTVDVSSLAAGTHTIDFRTIVDQTGVASNLVSDTFTVTIVTPNNPPVAVNDSAATNEDTPVVINVLANDSDPDGDLLAVVSVTQGGHGSAVITGGTVTYTPSADFHGSDSFTYTAGDGRGGTATATVSVTVNPIADIRIVALDADKAEGDSGTTPFTFTVSLDEPADATVTATWSIAGSSASPADAADFGGMLPSGSVTFLAGQTSQILTAAVSGDTAAEDDEGFVVVLANPSAGATIAVGSASGTIRNDDIPLVYSYVDVAESEASVVSTVAGTFVDTHQADGVSESIQEQLYQKDTRSRVEHQWTFDVTGGDLGVSFHLLAGHDSSAETFRFEYDAQDGLGWRTLATLSSRAMTSYSAALPGSVSGPVLVRVVDTNQSRGETSADTVYVDQMVFLSERLTSLPPRVSIYAIDAEASETGPGGGQFQVELTDRVPQASDVIVLYTIGGTANSADYAETLTGTVTIPAGQLSATISITPVDDTLPEGTETVVLTLLANPAYVLGVVTEATVTITDNDVRESLAQSESSVYGTVSGDYTATHSADGVYETLTEVLYSGGNKKSHLEHRWSFDLTGLTSVEFVLNASHLTPDDPDNFQFQFSTDGGTSWTNLVTLTTASPAEQTAAVSLPAGVGTVLVRVIDTDGSNDRKAASLRIDQMLFQRTDATAPQPVASEPSAKVLESRAPEDRGRAVVRASQAVRWASLVDAFMAEDEESFWERL